jgi:D-lactate dehydrogenase
MRVAVFSAKPHDRRFLGQANASHGFAFEWLEPRLAPETARLAAGFDAVCVFVNDRVDAQVVSRLADDGVGLIVLRSAGFNHVDVEAAAARGLVVARVPAYSPSAVAEHTVGLMLTLNRKFHRAFQRVREGNFALEGLLGFDMRGKTAGVVGTGRIGAAVAEILAGFGCRLLATDPYPADACRRLGVEYVELGALLAGSDIVTLHCPLTPESHHLIDGAAIERMKDGAMLINTSRGGLLDSRAAIEGLKSGRLGALGLDVYEEEADLFYENLSDSVIQDDVFARLLTFPNVLITSHQAFFTREALERIAEITLTNLAGFAGGDIPAENLVTPQLVQRPLH